MLSIFIQKIKLGILFYCNLILFLNKNNNLESNKDFQLVFAKNNLILVTKEL